MEGVDDPLVFLCFVPVLFEEITGSLKGIAFFLDQIENYLEIGNVLGGEETVTLFVFFGLDDVKFLFVKSDLGGVDGEHLRNLTHGVIKLVNFTIFIWHTDLFLLSQQIYVGWAVFTNMG